MGCLFHKWDSCKCIKCGKTKDENHKWDGCMCTMCGKTKDENHNWDFCKCTKCGKYNDKGHKWNGCVCTVCSKKRDEHHRLNGCTCEICSKEKHSWIDGKCSNCNIQLSEYFKQKIMDASNSDYDIQAQAYNKMWEVVSNLSFLEIFYKIFNDAIKNDPQAKSNISKTKIYFFAAFNNAVIESLANASNESIGNGSVDILQNLVMLKMPIFALSFQDDKPILECENDSHMITPNDIRMVNYISNLRK